MKLLANFPLHLQIFFAFAFGLLMVVICTIVLWLWNDDENRHLNAFATFSQLVEQNLPSADAPRSIQAAAIDSWMLRAHTRFALFAANGELLSRPLDPPLSFPGPAASGQAEDDWYGIRFVWQLKDKRVLVTQFSSNQQKRPLLFILMMLGLAVSVTLISFPVIRRLTARLESLQQSVESLGSGNLSARVMVAGRDEVAQLAASFNRSATQIEQLIQSQKQMLANASHELRSPLMRIQMAAALLAADDSPTRRELQRSVGELDTLVEEILTLSRLEMVASAVSGDFRPVDITAIAAEECASAQIKLCAGHVVADADARLIRRLLRNLIENAQRYAGNDISVNLKLVGDRHFTLEVQDRGPGIPADELDRIFQPFYRLSRSGKGSGLGLALVRSITEHHGGSITVQNRTGGGVRFCVRLPGAVT